MNEDYCTGCGRLLTQDEIGLHRKMVSRAADSFMCIDCLSAHFKIGVPELRRLIRELKAQGCTLFG